MAGVGVGGGGGSGGGGGGWSATFIYVLLDPAVIVNVCTGYVHFFRINRHLVEYFFL